MVVLSKGGRGIMVTEGKATTAGVQSTASLQGIELFNEMYLTAL